MELNGKSRLTRNQNYRLQWSVLAVFAVAQMLTIAKVSFASESRQLRVSKSGRHLVYENGEPFFWLADTGWEIFHRLTREEADMYLEKRAAQGFTVIQAMTLAEHKLFKVPNRYGHYPLIDQDPLRPNEDYFKHVDYVINKAQSLGMFVALVATWGDKVRKAWGEGPEIFNEKNALPYGRWLGSRYKSKQVIWILGGDRDPVGYESVWRAMARGLKEGCGGRQLATYHGANRKNKGSSPFFHKDSWLDFNFTYSGHRWSYPTYEQITRDRALEPAKPTLDGEPLYENHPVLGDGNGFYQNRKLWDRITRGTSHQIRQSAYWAMLAGAAGHTYGCHDVWQFHNELREPITHSNVMWYEAVNFDGSRQMGLMRRLFESRPWQKLLPDQSVIIDGQGEGELHVRAARASDRSFLFAYLPQGGTIIVDMTKLSGKRICASWFDPRNGSVKAAGEFPRGKTRSFKTPKSGRIWDWILVLDNCAKKFPSPGSISKD